MYLCTQFSDVGATELHMNTRLHQELDLAALSSQFQLLELLQEKGSLYFNTAFANKGNEMVGTAKLKSMGKILTSSFKIVHFTIISNQ